MNSPCVSQYSLCTVSIVETVPSDSTVMFIRCHTFQLQLCCTVTDKAAAAVLAQDRVHVSKKKHIIRWVGTLLSFLERLGGLRSSWVAKVKNKRLQMDNAQDEPHASERGTSKWCVRHTSADSRQSTHVASAECIFSLSLSSSRAADRIPSVIAHICGGGLE